MATVSKTLPILGKPKPTPPPPPPRKVSPERSDFRVFVDEESGSICVTATGYKFDKSIILTLDELPERYQAYFAKYVLCK